MSSNTLSLHKFSLKRSGSSKSSSQEKSPRSALRRRAKLCISKYNLSLVIICTVTLLIGTAIGIGLYFNYQLQEGTNAKTALEEETLYQQVSVQSILTDAERLGKTAANFYTLSGRSADYLTEYIPFVARSQLLLLGIDAIGVFQRVLLDDITSFTTSTRARSTFYTNFTITGRDASNNIIPYYPYNTSYVLTMTAPLNTVIIGYDLASTPVKKAAAEKSLSTGQQACTAYTLTSFSPTTSVILYTPIFNNGEPFAVTAAALIIPTLMANATLPNSLDDKIMHLYDASANDTLLYSSIRQDQIPYSGVSLSQMTTAQHRAMVKNAPFTTTTTVQVADRTWKIVFIPTQDYLNNFVIIGKLVWLIICIFLAVVFDVILIVFVKRLEMAQQQKKLDKKRSDTLQESQMKIQNVMNRISDTERQIRTTINAIPDFIIVISSTGKIITSNTSFDRQFSFSEVEYQKGVNISTIFSDLQEDFYATLGELDEINTIAKSRFLVQIPVQVSVRPLKTNDESEVDEEAFVIVAKNMSDRHKLLENLQVQENRMKITLKYAEFEAQFTKNRKFRDGTLLIVFN